MSRHTKTQQKQLTGRINMFVLAVLVCTFSGLTAFTQTVEAFSGGAGTSGDPYQITTAAELASVSSYLGAGNSGKYFKVMNDIDLNVAPYNTGTGWTPIGTGSNYFYGHFDGNFKTISGLYYNSASGNNVGLFGVAGNTAQIQNLLISNATVSGSYGAGALVGTNYGTITRVGVTGGSVTGIQRTGGLIGSNQGAVSYAFSNNSVYFNPTSSPTCCAGGLMGESYSGGSVNNSYSRSSVIMTYNAYNQGSIGGFMGNDYNSSTKTNLYSTGSITMVSGSFPSNVGGLSGGQYTSITGSYWDTQTSGRATSFGGVGVVGKTTAEMKTQSTYSGWDFSTIWAIDGSGVINNGYPYLQWQASLSTNSSPSVPSSLGPSSLVNGSASTATQPAFTFNLSDPNGSDTVKYQIQVDDSSDFSSPVIDYTSALAAQGSASFTVGQAAGGGTYTTGSSGQSLSDGSYYWRVKAIDNSLASSAYSTANSGAIAFKVDTTAPSVPGTPTVTTPANDNTPGWSWTASTDGGSGMNSYVIQWSSVSNFSSYSTTSTGSNSYTIPVSLSDGIWYFRVAGRDTANNVSTYSSAGSVTIDTVAPTLDSTSPTDNATDVVIDGSLVIVFSKPVNVGSGDIVIYRASDDSVVETIAANSGQVTGNGTDTLTITLSADFEYDSAYYVRITNTAVEDLAGNAYAGISDSVTWTFTTVAEPVVPVVPPASQAKSTVLNVVSSKPITATELVTANQVLEEKIILDEFPEFVEGIGKLLGLKVGQVLHFTVVRNGVTENHTATVKEIGEDYVILTIASTPFDVRLGVGELKTIAIEGDAVMQVNLLGVSRGLANLQFKRTAGAPVEAAAVTIPSQTAAKDLRSTLGVLCLIVSAYLVVELLRAPRRPKHTLISK